jgi:hypothetical protein
MRLKAAVALAGMTVLGALGVAAQAQQPNISGHWTFNAAQSDDPRDQMQGRDSAGGDNGGGGGGGGWRRGDACMQRGGEWGGGHGGEYYTI